MVLRKSPSSPSLTKHNKPIFSGMVSRQSQLLKAIAAHSLTPRKENLVVVNRLIESLREEGVRAFQERVLFERGGFVSQRDLCECQIVTGCFVIRVEFEGLS